MNIVQVLVNSLITSAELGLIAIGLGMTFSILRFANFAHVESAVLGAYLVYLFNVTLGWHFALSILVSTLILGTVGLALHRGDDCLAPPAQTRHGRVYHVHCLPRWYSSRRAARAS